MFSVRAAKKAIHEKYKDNSARWRGHTTTPTATLDVMRLINSQAAIWEIDECITSFSEEEIKRNACIVLSDFQFSESDSSLHALYAEGYQLYVAEGFDVRKITNALEIDETLLQIQAMPERVIHQMMTAKNIAHGRVIIWDHCFSNAILHPEIPDSISLIDIDSLLGRGSKIFQAFLSSIEDRDIGIICRDIFNNKYSDVDCRKRIDIFLKKMTDIVCYLGPADGIGAMMMAEQTITDKLQYLKLTAVNRAGLAFAERCSKLLQLELRLNGDIQDVDGERLSAAFASWPQLQILTLEECYHVSENINVNSFPETLRSFSAGDIRMTNDNFQQLLVRCKQLENISLRLADAGNTPFILSEDVMKLQQLELRNMDNAASLLSTLFHRCPRLKKLSLQGFSTSCPEDFILDKDLDALKVVIFDKHEMHVAILQTVLLRAHHLKALCLKDGALIDDDEFNLSTCLPLAWLFIEGEVHGKFFVSLLQHCRDLRLMQMQEAVFDEDYRFLETKIELPALTELYLNNRKLNQDTLNALFVILAGATHLRLLDLQGCKEISFADDVFHDTIELDHLEELNLDSATISYKTFYYLLCCAKNLKVIALSRTIFVDELEYEENDDLLFNRLVEINAYYSGITAKALQWLLRRSPHLEVFKLQGREDSCQDNILMWELGKKFPDGGSTLPSQEPKALRWLLRRSTLPSQEVDGLQCIDHNLPRLSVLDLSGATLDFKTLCSFGVHAKNIKELSLKKFSVRDEISELNFFRDFPFQNITFLDLRDTRFSSQQINFLLRKCPQLDYLLLSPWDGEIKMVLDFTGVRLEKLTRLSLERTVLSSAEIHALLASCPAIESLQLRSSTIGYVENSMPLQHLTRLVNLDLLGSNFCKKFLEYILQLAPQVRSLDISASTIFGTALQLAHDKTELRQLIASQSELSTKQFGNLLQHSPHLTYVELSGCRNIVLQPELAKRLAPITTVMQQTLSVNACMHNQFQDNTRTQGVSVANESMLRTQQDIITYDGDTADDDSLLYAEQTIRPKHHGYPSITERRMEVFPHILLQEKGVHLVKGELLLERRLVKKVPLIDLLTVYNTDYHETDNFFHIAQTFLFIPGKFYALSAVSSNDAMLFYAADEVLDISYCKNHNLYYASSREEVTQEKSLRIDFVVMVPLEKLQLLMQRRMYYENQSQLNDLISVCLSFTEGKLKGITEQSSGAAILQALHEQHFGNCVYRSLYFLHQAKQIGIQARACTCHGHMYVEVEMEGDYFPIDLGGYDAEMVMTPFAEIKIADEKEKEDEKENPFLTFYQSQPPSVVTVYQYLDWLFELTTGLPANKRNIMLFFDTEKQLEKFNLALMAYAKKQGRQYFHISNLSEIARYDIAWKNNISRRIKGDAFHFLQHANAHDFLTVNRFKPKPTDAAYNAMLDDRRKLDGTTIPDGVIQLCYFNKSLVSQMGDDISSRIFVRCHFPAALTEDLQLLSTNDAAVPTTSKKHRVDLYNGTEWERDLLGVIQLRGQQLTFEQGPLLQVSLSGQAYIVLENTAWKNNADFTRLITQCLLQKQIRYHGKKYYFADNFSIMLVDKNYDLNQGYTICTEGSWTYSINSKTYPLFFNVNRCEEDQIFYRPGWLQQHAGETLAVLVTENFDRYDWARLLNHAANYNVHFQLQVAAPYHLPEEMQGISLPKVKPLPLTETTMQALKEERVAVIVSQDLDFSKENVIDDLVAAKEGYLLIPAGESMQYADLMGTLKREQGEDEDAYLFHTTHSSILAAVTAGLTIIIVGRLSPEAAAYFESLFAEHPTLWHLGKQHALKNNSRFIFITDNEKTFSFSKKRYRHFCGEDDFWRKLCSKFTDTEVDELMIALRAQREVQGDAMTFSHIQLQHFLERKRLGDDYAFKTPILLSPQRKQLLSRLKKQEREKENEGNAIDIVSHRLAKIVRQLAIAKAVMVIGPTGSGKSTFILDELRAYYQAMEICVKLFSSLTMLKAWAATPDQHEKHILYLDEVNLAANGANAVFEGLFNSPPGVVIDGEFFPLHPERHYWLGSGNYYDAEYSKRKEDDFIKRHVAVVQFKRLKPAFSDKRIIRKILATTLTDEAQQIFVANLFLNFYRYVNEHYPQQQLTPRNLAMMSFRFLLIFEKNAGLKDASLLAQFEHPLHAAAVMAIYGEMADQRYEEQAIFALKKQFKKYQRVALHDYSSDDFIATASRRDVFRQLEVAIAIRELKIKHPTLAKMGVCAFSLEGAPGNGKSELLLRFLAAKGYQNGEIYPQQACLYFHLTPANRDRMLHLLDEAFHRGAYLIIDEVDVNVAEDVLNQYLSGWDTQGCVARQPGFCVFATKNGHGLAGRELFSRALQNRIYNIKLADYPADELVTILENKGVATYAAHHLVAQYEHAKLKIASAHQPMPTPRDLFNQATLFARPRALHDLPEKPAARGGKKATRKMLCEQSELLQVLRMKQGN